MADTRSPEDLVYELINGFRSSQLVALAADLNLADLLTEEPKTAATLARATGSHEPSLRRVLGGLCALGVFREDDDGRFHETPLSACLRSGRRAHAQARFSPREGAAAFAELAYTVRTGKPAYELVYGKARFEHLSQDADASARFNAGMAVQAEIDARAICEAIDLSSASTVVDVGGGRAALIATRVPTDETCLRAASTRGRRRFPPTTQPRAPRRDRCVPPPAGPRVASGRAARRTAPFPERQ